MPLPPHWFPCSSLLQSLPQSGCKSDLSHTYTKIPIAFPYTLRIKAKLWIRPHMTWPLATTKPLSLTGIHLHWASFSLRNPSLIPPLGISFCCSLRQNYTSLKLPKPKSSIFKYQITDQTSLLLTTASEGVFFQSPPQLPISFRALIILWNYVVCLSLLHQNLKLQEGRHFMCFNVVSLIPGTWTRCLSSI